ncbi:unnamed protein product [Victoria cruziana]
MLERGLVKKNIVVKSFNIGIIDRLCNLKQLKPTWMWREELLPPSIAIVDSRHGASIFKADDRICSHQLMTIIVMDECPDGYCANGWFHFDLNSTAPSAAG